MTPPPPSPRPSLLARCSRWGVGALLAAGLAACGDGPPARALAPAGQPAPEPLRIAVMMPVDTNLDPAASGLPDMSWALEGVNQGGVAGRQVELEYIDPRGQDLQALGRQIAEDRRYVAAIAPPGSEGLAQVAGFFVEQQKPLVSVTSASDDLLRAYGGKGAVWRTRQSDVAQTELLVRFARDAKARKIALVTSVETAGATFFSWFGFFAREMGFAETDVTVVTLDRGAPCHASVQKALAAGPEMIFVAADVPEDLTCVVQALPPAGPTPPPGVPSPPGAPSPRPRVVFADTGLDPYALEQLGGQAAGVEGFNSAGPEAFEAAFYERFGGGRLAPHGASEYDAVLLLAYGLEVSKGEGGRSLVNALKAVVDGQEETSLGWYGGDVGAALALLREGKRPALRGATGPLRFEPGLYMDLASSTLSHWTMTAEGLTVDQRYWTGDPSFLTSQGALVRPAAGQGPAGATSTWVPSVARADTWAVVAALSSGWSNYRHQADALQQYQALRAAGVPDDHIVLVMADDIAASPSNPLQGQVRNAIGGPDVRGGAVVDYGLTLTGDDLVNIIEGRATERTPEVIKPSASSNVYIYLAGHGGTSGIPLGASTTSAGLAGEGEVFSPGRLRGALCSLRSEQRLRRALVVVESCYSGAFGDASYGGLEQGCDGEGGPLEGVALLTAANSREVSFASSYDPEVRSWVSDSFSRNFAEGLLADPGASVGDLYADAYRKTAGSHPSVYNGSHAGRLTDVSMAEFFAP